MPRYDYRCDAGHKYERQEPFGTPSQHACERCGKPAHRLIVAPTVLFKAGGFYKTSNRSDARGSGSGGDSSSSSSSKSSNATPPASDQSPSTSHTSSAPEE